MPVVTINYVAVLVCGIVNMVLGFLWYGPIFGKPWAKMMGFDMSDKKKMKEMQKKMGPTYLIMFLMSMLTAYILTHFLQYALAKTAVDGVLTGVWAWMGFALPVTLANSLFGGKKLQVMAIDSGYYLVSFMIFGAILAMWV